MENFYKYEIDENNDVVLKTYELLRTSERFFILKCKPKNIYLPKDGTKKFACQDKKEALESLIETRKWKYDSFQKEADKNKLILEKAQVLLKEFE